MALQDVLTSSKNLILKQILGATFQILYKAPYRQNRIMDTAFKLFLWGLLRKLFFSSIKEVRNDLQRGA
jgi:hypothetical protein